MFAWLGATPAFAGAPTSENPWNTVDTAVSSWTRSRADKRALTGYIIGVRDEAIWEYKTDIKRLTGGKVLTGADVLVCPSPEPTALEIVEWLMTPKVLVEYGRDSLLTAVDAYMEDWLKSSCHLKGQ